MANIIRFQTPLEELPDDAPSLLEKIVVYLGNYVDKKDLFGEYEKERSVLFKGKEDLETGALNLDQLGPEGVPLVIGLLLLHLKFQTEPLIASASYEQCCQVITNTKGSTALASSIQSIIDSQFKPQRQRAIKAFFKYLWLVQNRRSENGVDSIALATRFGNHILRPPSGTEPTLPRVKLMGALAILIESRLVAGLDTAAKLPAPTPVPGGSLASSGGSSSYTGPATPETPPPPSAATSLGVQTKAAGSLSVSGLQLSEVSRSAVVIIDSSLKAFSKLKAQVASCNDEDKLVELLKRLKYLEGILGTGEGKDYAI